MAEHRHVPLRLVLSALAIAAALAGGLEFFFSAGLPFALERIDAKTFEIASLEHPPLPPDLKAGDRVVLARQGFATRVVLARRLSGESLPRRASFSLNVERGQAARTVRFTTQPVGAGWTRHIHLSLRVLFVGMLALIALVTFWRGRNWVAWSLGLWATTWAIGSATEFFPTGGIPGAALACASVPMYLLARVAFFAMATVLVAPVLGARARRAWQLGFAVVLAAGFAAELSDKLVLIIAGRVLPDALGLLWSAVYAVPALLLLSAYGRADIAQRLRLRWLLWSLAVFLVGIVISNLPFSGEIGWALGEGVAYVLALFGVLYAVLRHRVVDVSFVINRAVAYSATLSVVVAIFSLLETSLERSALGHNESLALELGVPLVLGLLLDSVHKRVDRLSERLFFRRKFEAQAALKRFAQDCIYIEDPEHLLDETVRELLRYTGARAVAIYERDEKGYVRVREHGGIGFPETVDRDDRAFVSGRAGRRETDLAEIGSALGTDGYVFPMTARGELSGAVVCANRPGGHYDPDERELVGYATREFAVALAALRARENEAFVKALARGELDPGSARDQARALIGISASA